jgi:cell division protein FtsL
MNNRVLYLIIAILIFTNISVFVYFYIKVSDLKVENKILEYKLKDQQKVADKTQKIDDRPILTW